MRKNIICDIILILLIVFEILLVLVLPEEGLISQPVNSILHFTVSVLIGVIILFKFYNKTEITIYEKLKAKETYVLYLLIAGAFLILNNCTIHIIKTFDYLHFSDIIPTIQILVKRLLSGQNPYDAHAMDSLLDHGTPGYLPMHWLPYSIAEFFHFDYRTITFTIWCIGALVIMARSMRSKNIITPLFVLLSLCGAYLLIAMQATFIIGATIEMMVAGYYMLFLAGLHQKNTIIAGLFIATCILSRYYIILWLPLWFFVLFLSGNKKKLFKISLSIFIFLLILYIIPFLSKNWSVPYLSFKNYEKTPIFVWIYEDMSSKSGHLHNGTGFAYFFYRHYMHTDFMIGYYLLKKVFYCAIFLTLLILGLWYRFNWKKIDYKIFLIASFKIYLSVFLSFILVPFLYLMITGIFVSIAIFAIQASYKTERMHNQDLLRL